MHTSQRTEPLSSEAPQRAAGSPLGPRGAASCAVGFPEAEGGEARGRHPCTPKLLLELCVVGRVSPADSQPGPPRVCVGGSLPAAHSALSTSHGGLALGR